MEVQTSFVKWCSGLVDFLGQVDWSKSLFVASVSVRLKEGEVNKRKVKRVSVSSHRCRWFF